MKTSTNVSYFRARKPGPELRIEDAVSSRLTKIFRNENWPLWVGGSVPIGAGRPDLVSVWYDPQVITFADFKAGDNYIIAYLRSVRRARIDTIAERLRCSPTRLRKRISWLEESNVVARSNEDSYSIAPAWRTILPKIVTIEAKVSNWQRALQQAIRNSIFAHRSYVALPEKVAERVTETPGFALYGVGILAVTEHGDVWIQRGARNSRQCLWQYYFYIAALTAKDLSKKGL